MKTGILTHSPMLCERKRILQVWSNLIEVSEVYQISILKCITTITKVPEKQCDEGICERL